MKQWKFGEWRIAKYGENCYLLQHTKCRGGEMHDCYLAKSGWKCNMQFGCGKEVPKDIQLLADLFYCYKNLFYRDYENK